MLETADARLVRPGPVQDLYARVSELGYLVADVMAVVSTEGSCGSRWNSPRPGPGRRGSNYAVPARGPGTWGLDFDGFTDIVTGHLSAYYDFGNGFQGQVDAGR